MTDYVLDSSALLALWFGEPGAEAVEAVISRAAVSTVSLSEAYAKHLAKRGDFLRVRELFEASGIEVVDFDEDLAVKAAAIRGLHPGAGLSFADRACLALAQRENAVALTSDKLWSALSGVGRVEQFR